MADKDNKEISELNKSIIRQTQQSVSSINDVLRGRLGQQFENPEKGAAPLVIEKEINSNENKLVVSSPPLPCIENRRNYNVQLTVFSNNIVVAEHRDQVQFSVPESMLSQLNVKVCNA